MKSNIKRKSGSAILLALVLGTVVIICATALSTSIVKSREYNERFNKTNDLELAAKSGIDIAKDYLTNKIEDDKKNIKSVNDIEYKLPNGYIDNIIENKNGIEYEVNIIKDKSSTDLIGVFNILSKASKDNLLIEKEEVIKVKIAEDNS